MQKILSILRELAETSCKYLSESPFPMRDWITIIHQTESSSSLPVEKRPDTMAISISIYSLVEKHFNIEELSKVISYDTKLNSRLLVDAGGNPIVDIPSQKWWLITFLVMPILTSYFSLRREYSFDYELFIQVAEGHLSELLLDRTTLVSISPLAHVRIVSDSIEIDKGIRIRRLLSDEIEPWLNPSIPLFGNIVPGQVLTEVRTAIEVTTESTSNDRGLLQPDQSKFKDIIDTLRLVTDSDIIVLFTQTQSHGGPGLHATQTVPTSIPYWRAFGPLIIINEEQSSQLVKLYHQIKDSINAEKISLARTRWSITSERLTLEDKLIDCWIGLESLFTPDSSQELSFRASLRIATFLAPAGIERQRMYSDIRTSYEWRSALIHGDSARFANLSKRLTLSDATSIVRGALRNAILRILDMNEIFNYLSDIYFYLAKNE